VLADDYSNCRYLQSKKSVEYTIAGKQYSASIYELVQQFGQPLEIGCGKEYTIYVLEKAIARTVGGETIARTGSIIQWVNEGNYTTGEFLEYDRIFKSERAIKSKIAWNSVVVVMTSKKTLHIYKGLQNKRFGHVQADYSEADLATLNISISGSEWDTLITLEWSGGKKSVRVMGMTKDEMKIREN